MSGGGGADKKEGTGDAQGGGAGQARDSGMGQDKGPKAADKSPPQDQAGAGGKDKGDGSGQGAASQAKGDSHAPPQPGQNGQGATKGDPQDNGGGQAGGQARPENRDPQGNGQAASKGANPDGLKTAGAGKNDQRAGGGQGGSDRKITREDVELLAKAMKELPNAKDREHAEKGLEFVRDMAPDAEVRQAAEDALKKAGKGHRYEPAGAKDAGAKEEKAPANAKVKGTPVDEKAKQPTATAKDQSPQQGEAGKKKEGEGQTQGKQASTAKTKGDSGMGGSNRQNALGVLDAIKPNPVNLKAALHAGNLQLEGLPEELRKLQKRLNWSDQELANFVRDMQTYDRELRAKSRPKKKATTPEQLIGGYRGPGLGPQQIGGGTQKLNTERGGGARPPEFEDAYLRFTTSDRTATDSRKTPPK